MKIFYNNNFCKCLATWTANDSAAMYLNNGVWTFRSDPYTVNSSGINCIF